MNFYRHAVRRLVAVPIAASDRGYRLADDPDAQFQMSVYALNLDKADPGAAEAALNYGYAGAILAGAAVGALANRREPWRGTVSGGLLAGPLPPSPT